MHRPIGTTRVGCDRKGNDLRRITPLTSNECQLRRLGNHDPRGLAHAGLLLVRRNPEPEAAEAPMSRRAREATLGLVILEKEALGGPNH
jgi:hypothetical protein